MKVPAHVRALVKEDGAAFVNTITGGTFTTNAVGARVWQGLQEGRSTQEIVDGIEAAFSVPRATVERDVQAFLDALAQMWGGG